jgi:hypothetical protein
MQAVRRQWFRVVIMVLIGALTAFCICLWPHERLLLERATRAQPEGPTEKWPDDWHQAPMITFRDQITGKTRHVRFSRRPEGTHTRLIYSPDGQWGLSWDGGGPEPGQHVVAMELQTGRTLSWPNLGQTYHHGNYWMPDSHHWLQYSTMPDGYLTMYDVTNPKEAIHLPFPDYQKSKWLETGHDFTRQNHILIHNERDDHGTPWDSLTIRDYRLLPSVRLVHTWHALSPTSQEFEEVAVSPDGDRIAVFCNDTYISPLLAWLHRWLPRVPATPQQRLSLWVMRIDGTNPREIGHIPATAPDPNGQPDVSDLLWFPSGKHLSFEYKDKLYTVPAE